MSMSFLGALCMAGVTASLTASFELAPEEAWLVRKLETREELKRRERCALALMQATARMWIAQRKRAKLRPETHRRASTEAAEERIGKCRHACAEAAAAFRHARHLVTSLTQVHTLAVLHTSVDALRTDQQQLGAEQRKLNAKLDALLRAMGETTKSVQAIQLQASQRAGP